MAAEGEGGIITSSVASTSNSTMCGAEIVAKPKLEMRDLF